jgi:hypothetical protein
MMFVIDGSLRILFYIFLWARQLVFIVAGNMEYI